MKALKKLLNMIQDTNLRNTVQNILIIPKLTHEDENLKNLGLPLESSPASKKRHHSYPKGLIDHTVVVANLFLALSDAAENIYGGKVNHDLVLAGALLHDICKPITYVKEKRGYHFSYIGEKLGHLTLILCELYKKNASLELLHVIATHHGMAGPIAPKTIEALILHVADVADATLNREILRAANFLIQTYTGEDFQLTTAKEVFDIISAKQWM